MTAPPLVRTFVAFETETAAFLNSLGGAGIFLAGPPRCKVVQNAAQTLTTGVWAAVTWDAETYDTDTMHSTSSNTSRIVATTSGLYVIAGVVSFTGNATGARQIELRKNAAGAIAGGTEVDGLASVVPGAGAFGIPFCYEVQLAAGDYVEMFAFQSSGANLALIVGSGFATWAAARWASS